ncbi:MAG: NAD(P)/FAD-dependent oxidoreductase [Sedimentisphaerales bacterium]|nr:NAD(P)/FAD-dependent oxidoreductase [Sedimentisphaerales bacterium]
MEPKSIAIVGAGIAGLSTGCYGQMNGYRTRIFEMHGGPGGLCTSWKRGDYTIDGCLRWLVGSGPGIGLHRVWQELGAIGGQRIVDHEEFLRFEGKGGKVLVVYSDIDRLERHMKELAPQDARIIDELIRAARKCAKYDLPVDKAPELYGLIDGIKFLVRMFPMLRLMSKWKKVTVEEGARKFSDPFLREALSHMSDLPDFPMATLIMILAWLQRKSAGYPEGGSLEFSRRIERRYLDLGGEIHYRSPVREILVENDRAVGVRLADGSEHRADIIISAADGHATIFDLVRGRYINKKIRGYYDKLALFPPLIHVALGVARSFDGLPSAVTYALEEPVTIGGTTRRDFTVELYNFDRKLAPPGKTVVKVMFPADYTYWKNLRQDPQRYKAEKEKVADQVIALLDRRYPGLAGQVEMRDVATPMTWERCTGNWQGSFEGWMITKETFPPFHMSKTLPGLANFYMAGQWVEPGGGVPTAAMSGRNVIQIICKRDRKTFVTRTP